MAAALPIIDVKQSAELDSLVGAWWSAHKTADEAVATEMEARMALFRYFYKESDPKCNLSGREKFGMPSGWVLEIQRRLNYSVDVAALDSIRKAVAALPVDPDSGEIASIEAAIKYRLEVSESGYRDLRHDAKALLNEALTVKPGAPSLKLEYKEKAKPVARPDGSN
jgi:hypothetical protein